MNEIYLTTKQVTSNGEAVTIVKVTGESTDDAIINARIKMSDTIKNFKANKVLYAYADVRQLNNSAPLDYMEWTNPTSLETKENTESGSEVIE